MEKKELKQRTMAWAFNSDVWKQAIEPYIQEGINDLKEILTICPKDEIDVMRGKLASLEEMRRAFIRASADEAKLTQIQEESHNDKGRKTD